MRLSGFPYIQGKNARTPVTNKYAIAIHNTSNVASSEAEAQYATRRSDGIGAHLFADDDGVIQSIDTANTCWHAGSSNGNHNAVAVEITGLNSRTREWWLNNVAWDELGNALAQICRYYGIPVRRCTVEEMRKNPQVKGFYSHNDMRLAWGGTTHDDPGPNFPWDELFKHVNAALNPSPVVGDDMTPEQWETLKRIDQRVTAIFYGMDTNPYPSKESGMKDEPNKLKQQLDQIERQTREGV